MKTGRILLMAVASVVIAVLIAFTVILRNTIHHKRAAYKSAITYKTIPLGKFDRIYLAGGYTIHVKQGKNCLVEYGSGNNSEEVRFVNMNGTLHLMPDTMETETNRREGIVRITLPELYEITAEDSASIQIGYFQSDSIKVNLGNACIFNGNNNTIKHVSFNTSGKVAIKVDNTL